MRTSSAIAIAATIHLFSTTAFAQPDQAERFLVNAPDGFVFGANMSRSNDSYVEYIKKGQSVEDWSDMITVQSFHGASHTPAQFLQEWGNRIVGACPGTISKNNIHTGTTNGFTVSMLDLWCPNNPGTGKPETIFIRVVKGNDALYSVQYAWRSVPSNEQIDTAVKFLATVTVCDSRSNEHRCPSGTATQN